MFNNLFKDKLNVEEQLLWVLADDEEILERGGDTCEVVKGTFESVLINEDLKPPEVMVTRVDTGWIKLLKLEDIVRLLKT